MRARLPLLVALVLATAFAPLPAAAATDRSVAALWRAPLAGVLTVTRPFDPPPDRFGAGHRGVDLAGAPGAAVLAAGSGVVVFAGMVAGRPVVSIDHPDGLRTTYEPVVPSVAAGRRVTRGFPVGTLAAGHAGCPHEACLHWGLRRGETYLDPMRLLRPVQVRLLPSTGRRSSPIAPDVSLAGAERTGAASPSRPRPDAPGRHPPGAGRR